MIYSQVQSPPIRAPQASGGGSDTEVDLLGLHTPQKQSARAMEASDADAPDAMVDELAGVKKQLEQVIWL